MEFLRWVVLFSVFPFCSSNIETISPERSLLDGSLLLSKGKVFAMGFFTPGNSSASRYVGIWYFRIPKKTVVWVANRDNPINGSSGVLSIDRYGNLILTHPERNSPLWSTNTSVSPAASSHIAKLLDTGNLVLAENDSDKVVWQSFDHPCDTMLPGMKVGLDLKSGLNRFLTSWKSPDDPGTGEYSVKVVLRGSPQLFLYKGSTPIWRPRPWPWTRTATLAYSNNYSFVNHEDEVYFTFALYDASVLSRLLVDGTAMLQSFTWLGDKLQWIGTGLDTMTSCDTYGKCGAFSKCDPSDIVSFECSCLSGFEPRSPRYWSARDWSGGCVRKHGELACDSEGGFLKVGDVKIPDTSVAITERGLDSEACEEACLRNCSCSAYARIEVEGESSVCFTWYGDLIDTVVYNDGNSDLYVRVDAIELAEYARKSKGFLQKKGKIAIPVLSAAVALFLMGTLAYLFITKKRKARESVQRKYRIEDGRRHPDFPFLDLSTIIAATDNFCPFNKLGQGGFGPVYKGRLPDGQEIAVKRLSKNSAQGIPEFKNEVALIAQLQHQNLVKLLGSCVEGEEMMLIYEYLPNKSLDTFIFDQKRKVILDWRNRFEIIVGIARGILYLHQDSRLRIIHRDLKTSNILLDAEMNPKISDFGMARIFGGDEIQDNTKRVVGTYGYMSPEYAVFGKFSTKSDVFSFGVILLEIVSSKRNNCSQTDFSSNLIGHVWELWREDRALEIADSSLRESLLPHEVLRCIHVGLLCVQERVADRPNMLEVVLMLVTESTLPFPNQPAFIFRTSSGKDGSTVEAPCSVNNVTMSNIIAR